MTYLNARSLAILWTMAAATKAQDSYPINQMSGCQVSSDYGSGVLYYSSSDTDDGGVYFQSSEPGTCTPGSYGHVYFDGSTDLGYLPLDGTRHLFSVPNTPRGTLAEGASEYEVHGVLAANMFLPPQVIFQVTHQQQTVLAAPSTSTVLVTQSKHLDEALYTQYP